MKTLFNRLSTGILALALLAPSGVFAADVKDVLRSGAKRTDASAKRQNTVDGLAAETDKMFREYVRLLKENDTLRAYIKRREREIERQQAFIAKVKDDINQISKVVRGVGPLMDKMTDALSTFIERDVPFLHSERTERIDKLRAVLERPDVSEAEKFRKVLEAYQIELEYGNTIETYKDDFTPPGGARERVHFLRIGRVALVAQSFDGSRSYMWNSEGSAWEQVSSAIYGRAFKDGIAIADKRISPDLLVVPVAVNSSAAE